MVVIHYPRGGHPYKSGGDARRLALRRKLRILVSLRVFGMESHYRLVLCIKKCTKNALQGRFLCGQCQAS